MRRFRVLRFSVAALPAVVYLPLSMMACCLGGCQATPPARPEVVVDPAAYDAAFAQAVSMVRDLNYPPELIDPRSGIIETEPNTSPTLLEPWAWNDAGLDSTLHMQRRRVRVEFRPQYAAAAAHVTDADDAEAAGVDEGDRTEVPTQEPTGEVTGEMMSGPDMLGLDGSLQSIAQSSVPLAIDVYVFVEQMYQPGLRRDTWTRQRTTRSVIIDPVTAEPIDQFYWVPVARDLELERRLLRTMQQRIAPAERDDGSEP